MLLRAPISICLVVFLATVLRAQSSDVAPPLTDIFDWHEVALLEESPQASEPSNPPTSGVEARAANTPLSHPFAQPLVTEGKRLFAESCTQCHEAEQATDQRKSYVDWLATVESMAAQEDATIPQSSFVPIATYLASLGPPDKTDVDRNDDRDSDHSMGGMTNESGAAGEKSTKDGEAEEGGSRAPQFDPQDVARGQSAFRSSCTQCHDAGRALNKRKSLSGWLATVRRMARMDGANVSTSDVRPIAVYLASLSAPAGGDSSTEADMSVTGDDMGSGLNLSGTISTLWRGGNDNLENPNFFADAWVTMDWQPEGPLRGRVTTCTSCHSDQSNGSGFTLELVEAVATFDLMYAARKRDPRPEECKSQVEAEIRAGRLVVPFGQYHTMSHPGAYRTVTNPLMFNMGRQVNADGARPPVLPMPYSDEGVDLHTMIPLRNDWKINLDGFAVNGLQGGGSGVNFTRSRSYTDNNRHAGYGGRATLSNQAFLLGGSLMAGRLEDEGSTPLNYHLVGGDATARLLDDNARLYFEYAMRRNGSVFGQRQISYGIVAELELLLLENPHLSALVRYDTLEHRDFFGDSSIERFTWGLTTNLGGGQLIFNHEHWNFPTDDTEDVDVFGIRWVATF